MHIHHMLCVALLCLSAILPAADTATATATTVPVTITTNHGVIELELWPEVAPETVANFVGLATGAQSWEGPGGKQHAGEPFYDGLTFHRVIPGFMIQGGDPAGDGSGGPGYTFEDEISAQALGLEEEPLLQGETIETVDPRAQHQLGIYVRQQLVPKLLAEGHSMEELRKNPELLEAAVLEAVADMSLADLYRANGYVYQDDLPSQPPVRGRIAMANRGANTNSSQFFITVADTPHLTGLHTVFGEVVAGMDVVDAIAAVPADRRAAPEEPVIIESVRVGGE